MSNKPLVVLTWEDSRHAEQRWHWLSEYVARKPVVVHSVGWLIQDDDSVKVLAQTLAPDSDDVQAAGLKMIPSRCVLRIERLIEADDDETATVSATETELEGAEP